MVPIKIRSKHIFSSVHCMHVPPVILAELEFDVLVADGAAPVAEAGLGEAATGVTSWTGEL